MSNRRSTEQTCRRRAARQGLALHGTNRKDPLALGYGNFYLVPADTPRHLRRSAHLLGGQWGSPIEDIAAYLATPWDQR